MKVRRFFSGGFLATWLAMTALTVVTAATPALALDTFMVGPRAMGMGGANVASVDNTTAQYYNPAAFGFFDRRTKAGKTTADDNNDIGRKKWGMDLNASAGYRLHNKFGNYLDDLSKIDINLLSSNIQSQSDLENLINLVKDLNGLNQPGNAISADLNGGLGVRVGHFGLGVRVFAEATGRVLNLDTTHLGLTLPTDINTQIGSVPVSGYTGQTASLFTSSQQQLLLNAGLTQDSINKLDYLARQQGVTQDQLQGVTNLLSTLTQQTLGTSTLPSGSLSQNTTTIRLDGFGLAEVPLSYGYAINDHWAVGGNIKLMEGRVYGTQIVVFNTDSGSVLSKVDQNYKQSTNFGLDLSLMGRYRYVNFGLVARDINSPTFDGPTVSTVLNDGSVQTVKFPDVTVDPQVSAGVAFIPFRTLTLEADCDLTRNNTSFTDFDPAHDSYRTQNLSFGLEWNAFHFLALRAGTYRNLAESDVGWVYTAGLGVNLWAVRFDLAGAFAGKKAQFNGHDIPQETRVSAQLAVDF